MEDKKISPREYFVNKDKITIYDDIVFSTINEASNLIFGTDYKGQRNAWFKIKTIKDKDITAWFPQLAIKKDNVMVASSNGWNNTINQEDIIFEYNELNPNDTDTFSTLERVTFMKMNRKGYKFLGVFLPVSKINGKVTYQRIATEFKIIRN